VYLGYLNASYSVPFSGIPKTATLNISNLDDSGALIYVGIDFGVFSDKNNNGNFTVVDDKVKRFLTTSRNITIDLGTFDDFQIDTPYKMAMRTLYVPVGATQEPIVIGNFSNGKEGWEVIPGSEFSVSSYVPAPPAGGGDGGGGGGDAIIEESPEEEPAEEYTPSDPSEQGEIYGLVEFQSPLASQWGYITIFDEEGIILGNMTFGISGISGSSGTLGTGTGSMTKYIVLLLLSLAVMVTIGFVYRKSKRKATTLMLVLAILASPAHSFANDIAGEIVKEHRFSTKNASSIEAEASEHFEQAISEDGKEYVLKDLSFVILDKRENEILEKEFTGLSESEVPETVEHEGREFSLRDVSFTSKSGISITASKEFFTSMNVRPPQTTEIMVDGRAVAAQLINVEALGEEWSSDFVIDAIFSGDPYQISRYLLPDGTSIPVNHNTPEFRGYEDAILIFRGYDPTRHRITAGRWTSEFDGTARHAEFTGDRLISSYRANYGVQSITYDAAAVYERITDPTLADGETIYDVLATAIYLPASEGLTLAQIILRIAAGLFIVALLAAAILFVIGKKKKKKTQNLN